MDCRHLRAQKHRTRETVNIDVLIGAAIGAIAAAIVNGVFNQISKRREIEHQKHMKFVELKQQRMQIALDLAKLKNEQLIEAARNTRGANVSMWDPAVSVADYLEALEEIDQTGRWRRGDQNAYPNGSPRRWKPRQEGES